MYYTVYKVTNKISGKFYVGAHKTKNLDGGYMGSGKYLRHSINKHGLENFEKEILFIFDDPAKMYAKEAEIVNETFLADENTYNLRVGGYGGFDYINANLAPEFTKTRAKKGRNATDVVLEKKYGDEWRKELSSRATKQLKNLVEKNPDFLKNCSSGFTGKIHKKETIEKIQQAAKKRYLKENNPSLGKRWIYCEEEHRCMLIPREENTPTGWKDGRKMKF